MTTDELMALHKRAAEDRSAHNEAIYKGVTELRELVALNLAAEAYEAALRSALEQVVADSERLDWIGRQSLTDLCMSLVVDGPRDGQYFVGGDAGDGYGKTFREAIDTARKASNANK